MINWANLAANALWILGCALALATLSYASWQASLNGEKLSTRLGQSSNLICLNLAGGLFCAGLAATSDSALEIALWVILGMLFFIQLIRLIRQARSSSAD